MSVPREPGGPRGTLRALTSSFPLLASALVIKRPRAGKVRERRTVTCNLPRCCCCNTWCSCCGPCSTGAGRSICHCLAVPRSSGHSITRPGGCGLCTSCGRVPAAVETAVRAPLPSLPASSRAEGPRARDLRRATRGASHCQTTPHLRHLSIAHRGLLCVAFLYPVITSNRRGTHLLPREANCS